MSLLEKNKQYSFSCNRFVFWLCDDFGFIIFYKISYWKRPNGLSINVLKPWFRLDYEKGKFKIVKDNL